VALETRHPEHKAEIAKLITQSNSLGMVQTVKSAQPLAVMLVVIFVAVILALVFVPWQQTITGIGKVSVFSPMSRPQTIEAPILGRIVQWYVLEGQDVKAGQPIVQLVDLDPKFLDREQVARLEGQVEALKARRAAAEQRVAALSRQQAFLTDSRNVAIPGAIEKTRQTGDRYYAAQQAVAAAKQNLVTADLNLVRRQELYEKGLRSKRDLELAELDQVRAKTDLERAEAALEVAGRDRNVAQFDQNKVAADTAATLDSVAASIASAQETIASTTSDIYKLEIELNNIRTRTDQRIVRAPRDGRIVRLLKLGAGETVDSGVKLATLVPSTHDQAVELFIADNDVPLVSVGDHVRLQFAGWPALQFIGWPGVAVGTFAGEVAVIDMVDDGKKRYRVLVRPDWQLIKAKKEDPWPSPDHLRPGSEVIGWVMIATAPEGKVSCAPMPCGEVPLGFELWRQFNGFPPTVAREHIRTQSDLGMDDKEEEEKTDDGKGTKRKSKK
jgi:multidrug resistance efflux pump